MASITINPGMMGDFIPIYVQWTDHNGIQHENTINIEILPQDKPRTLRIGLADDKYQFYATNGNNLELNPSIDKLKAIASYAASINASQDRAVKNTETKEHLGYWQTKEWVEGLHDLLEALDDKN